MGCDIHCYKEKFVGGQWVTADEWVDEYGDGEDVPYKSRFTDRNYNLFSVLSKGVRGEQDYSFEPRGIPFNTSEPVKAASDKWDGDGHSHSYLHVSELREMQAYLAARTVTISGMKDREELTALRASAASDSPNWKLLYPYCGGTNSPNYDNFSIDVPAGYILGDGLHRLIESFGGIDGENHRIVFWFDN